MTCSLIAYLSGQSAESWTAVWTCALVVATLFLAAIAWVQIATARSENRKTQTLLACGNYDLNDVIFKCQADIGEARQGNALLAKARSLRLEIKTIFNFLDSIAIGIEQGLYVDKLAYRHMHSIIRGWIEEIVENEAIFAEAGFEENDFATLMALDERWTSRPPM